ncbi:4'-phosphopantetheinyl transferase superfamily protein [Namhaeicola litoreus]|uniref:4'-phosphopantetheinyl transferase superfamily protein n=1 Tax=Namhaeicola litoreus TaxID=1052145 RepID=A0ABW3Y0E9_9FLAO
MPLYRSIKPNEYTDVYVWKIEETLGELLLDTPLKDSSKNRMQNMRSQVHQMGFLSVRHLLKVAGYNDFDLYYNEHGKPFLQDGKYISITHSHNFSGIVVSDHEVGIDIEKNRPKIVNIQDKFVNTEVDSLSDEDLVKQLTVVWGAKEAMYKMYPFGGMSFKQHIAIDPFLFAEKRSKGRVEFGEWKRRFMIYFDFFVEDFTLVYAIPE